MCSMHTSQRKVTHLIEHGDKKRILGECLLISSLPGKALRTLVDIARLARLDIKRREPGILFISLPIVEHSSN